MSHEERWNESFAELVKYHSVHHHCLVPKSFHSESTGSGLGRWVNKQRLLKASLDPARREKLDALNFDWQPAHPFDMRWEKNYEALRAYHLREGHCWVPKNYETDAGIQLGTWVANQRRFGRADLKPDRASRLATLNFEWGTTPSKPASTSVGTNDCKRAKLDCSNNITGASNDVTGKIIMSTTDASSDITGEMIFTTGELVAMSDVGK
uniref:Helicase-associated domain-containing protein n=1 Tax=Octactis speculum TaxID=3111310 RepID=A0A7S2FLS3_9STRA|mmetsp:Transcript_25518/g.35079  ORF Transcript_25518/g.35079 Transcript_25518/m.35079 type:complete len:209 (+) Transcript_25518:185-811(+)